MNTKKFLKVEEVAKRMRFVNMTIYRMIHSGELPAIKFGKSFRIPEDALDQYLLKKYNISNDKEVKNQ
jgi:excisionase family DNA binding protein